MTVENRNDEGEHEIRQNEDMIEDNQNSHKNEMRHKKEGNDVGENFAIGQAIEIDPDLSVANSTTHKSRLDKDPDISLDGDEHFEITPHFGDKAERNLNEEKEQHLLKNEKTSQSIDSNLEQNYDYWNGNQTSPPPFTEIVIPVEHDYGYGFYLKPLWSLDSKPKIEYTERLEKVRQLISEGRMRRKRKDLTKLVINARSE